MAAIGELEDNNMCQPMGYYLRYLLVLKIIVRGVIHSLISIEIIVIVIDGFIVVFMHSWISDVAVGITVIIISIIVNSHLRDLGRSIGRLID